MNFYCHRFFLFKKRSNQVESYGRVRLMLIISTFEYIFFVRIDWKIFLKLLFFYYFAIKNFFLQWLSFVLFFHWFSWCLNFSWVVSCNAIQEEYEIVWRLNLVNYWWRIPSLWFVKVFTLRLERVILFRICLRLIKSLHDFGQPFFYLLINIEYKMKQNFESLKT